MPRYHRSLLLPAALAATFAVFVTPVLHAQTPGAAPTESGALHRSLWGTVLPIAAGVALAGTNATDPDGLYAAILIAAGITAGPSWGHAYAGQGRRATRHTLIRAGVLLAASAGFLVTCDYCLEEEEVLPMSIAAAGMLTLAAHATYDITTAPSSARRSGTGLSLSPWTPLGARGAGVRATWRF